MLLFAIMEDIDPTSQLPFDNQFPGPEGFPQSYDIPGEAVTATEAEGAAVAPDTDIPITAPDDYVGETDGFIGDHEPVTALPEAEYGTVAADLEKYARAGRHYGDEAWAGDQGHVRAIEPDDMTAESLDELYDKVDVITAEPREDLQYAVGILTSRDGTRHESKAVSFTKTEGDEPRWVMTSDAILSSPSTTVDGQALDAPPQGRVSEDGATFIEDGQPMTIGELRKILRALGRAVEV